MKIKIGLDEAGRGCVLGPLYVGAAVFTSSGDDEYFREQGVKDSKQLTAEKRNTLFSQIKNHCYTDCKIISTSEIDSGNLNTLEFDAMASLATDIILKHKDAYFREVEFEVYIDCPTHDSDQHARDIRRSMPHSCSIRVISEHKADDNYIVVGASSIIAKVSRDREIDRIRSLYSSEYGDLGSGYPSDWRTKKFLEDYFKKNRKFPTETRMKWGTVEKIRREHGENTELDWEELRSDIENSKRNRKSV